MNFFQKLFFSKKQKTNAMHELNAKYINAKSEFIDSKGSEKSVENLYDLIYVLKEIKERNFNENFILAEIYYLVGKRIYSSKIIENSLKNCNAIEFEKLMFIKNKLDNDWGDFNIKIYRDLRDAKLVKQPTKLNIEDFIIRQNIFDKFCLDISDKIKYIVILNKNFKNEDIWGREFTDFIISENEPNNKLLLKIVDYIQWLGEINKELIYFYNDKEFDHKVSNVGQEWFDSLNIFDFSIKINKNNDFETKLIIHDYFQNDFGFFLRIENKAIISIEYDPIL